MWLKILTFFFSFSQFSFVIRKYYVRCSFEASIKKDKKQKQRQESGKLEALENRRAASILMP